MSGGMVILTESPTLPPSHLAQHERPEGARILLGADLLGGSLSPAFLLCRHRDFRVRLRHQTLLRASDSRQIHSTGRMSHTTSRITARPSHPMWGAASPSVTRTR